MSVSTSAAKSATTHRLAVVLQPTGVGDPLHQVDSHSIRGVGGVLGQAGYMLRADKGQQVAVQTGGQGSTCLVRPSPSTPSKVTVGSG